MKNRVARFTKILLSVLIVFAVSGVLDFALSPITYGHWIANDREKYAGKIDTVIVGDSYYMYAIQPSLLDKELDCFSINESTASQSMQESYHIIWDYIETERIKTVYIGLDHLLFLNSTEDISAVAMNICYERLKSPKVKRSFLKNFTNFNNIVGLVFPAKVYRNNFLSIHQNIQNKLSYEYRNYLPLEQNGFIYQDKGYIYTEKVEKASVGSFDMNEMNMVQVDWLEKIIQLCREYEVTVNLFQSPTQHIKKNTIKNYEVYRSTIQKLADKYDCKYYDFNFYYEREKLDDRVCFRDSVHFNDNGSKVFMKWFCKVFSYEEDVTDKFFNFVIS